MSDEDPRWFVVHTRSRHESVVSRGLEEKGVVVFLPLVERLRQWRDRKKVVKFPLFPGYLFVRIIPEYAELTTVLQQTGVVRFLGNQPFQPEAVSDIEVENIKRLVTGSYEIDPYPLLKEGQRVRVKYGALAGVEGFLVKKADRHLLVLNVDVLREGVALRISASDVEAVG